MFGQVSAELGWGDLVCIELYRWMSVLHLTQYVIEGRGDDARSIWTAGKFRVDKVMIVMGIDSQK